MTTGAFRAAIRLAAGAASLGGERLAAAGLQVRSGPWLALLGASVDAAVRLESGTRRARTWLLDRRLVRRWERLGAIETAAGRLLVGRLVDNTTGKVLERVAASPELEATVHRASTSIAESTLNRARSRSQRADTKAERLVRRILGHD